MQAGRDRNWLQGFGKFHFDRLSAMTGRTDKIEALDSVRGLMALWVMCAHVIDRVISDNSLHRIHAQGVLEPLLPVYVFMILSGFVIFLLLDKAREPYAVFLTRRFFRLAPLFLVMLGVSCFTLAFELRTLDNLFWRNSHVYDSIKIHQETLAHFWPHLAAHATLMHGLVSDRWLMDSNFTFLSQGWSISLEWQFYVVAPLAFLWLQRQQFGRLAILLGLVAALGSIRYASAGFLPNQFVYFAVGAASYFAWRDGDWFRRIHARAHDMALLVIGLCLFFALKEPLPMLVWLLVLDLLLAQRAGIITPLTGLLDRVLSFPALRWLGEISYSVYLVHMTLLYVVFRAVTKLDHDLFGWKFLFLALPGTVALTLLVAIVTHRFIEKPGMALGKKIAARIGARLTKAPLAG